ncbi:LacI family DNA-binding transcriptional regulator [Aliivibrio salmonicida]|uniref:LacI family DNA-binding transcriptional regulator n=1 Tax=Aliivibrio salmonicida TaxID=40269 RepID=UPI003D13A1DA
MATINDVCKLAGVSKATVSRVMNGKGPVKEETKKLIFDAMETLNYKPSLVAQALATNSSNSIGLIVSFFDGYYFGILLKEATRIAEESGKQLIVTDGHNQLETEIEAINSLVSRKCDAILIYSRTMTATDYCKIQETLPIPLVVINRTLPDGLGHAVAFDQYDASRMAIEHLIELKHKNIAIITISLASSTGKIRLQGAKETLEKHGVHYDESLTIVKHGKLEDGYQACKELLSKSDKITAIFCFNDHLALGAIKALKEMNLRVPEDISIVGIDNDEISAFLSPALTTINVPIQEITQLAMNKALALISDKEIKPTTEVLTGELIIRDSSIYNKNK